ncbi:MAG TPA: nucleotidyltransferase domain-containing protein [Roseiflexaceae bacterium]|nr:nucleotidyltransferase domain-containing protein [Roseiflexaceae bacterium]
MASERQQALQRLCRRSGVAALYVFGSRAAEVYEWLAEQRADLARGPSDVDIGVHLPPELPWSVRDTVDLMQALEDLLGVARVDLVVLNTADPFVAAAVIRGHRLFAADERAADEYDLYVLRRAGDLIPLERERMDLIFGGA